MSQTETIGTFLSQTVSTSTSTSLQQQTLSASLISSTYTDLLSPLMAMFWAPIRVPSSSLIELSNAYLPRAKSTLLCLNSLLGDSQYFCGDHPMAGDFFVFNSLIELRDKFGHIVLDQTRVPNLVRFFETVSSRERIANYLVSARRLTTITRSPMEAEVSSKLEALWVW